MKKGKKQSCMTLKIKTLQGYRDMDTVLLHAAFQVLSDFIELEQPGMVQPMKKGEKESFKGERENRRSWHLALIEMKALYKWWTKERPARKSIQLPNKYSKRLLDTIKNTSEKSSSGKEKYSKKDDAAYKRVLNNIHIQQASWDEEDNKNLYRLISIREFMWT